LGEAAIESKEAHKRASGAKSLPMDGRRRQAFLRFLDPLGPSDG
jgi:hypothetical protein